MSISSLNPLPRGEGAPKGRVRNGEMFNIRIMSLDGIIHQITARIPHPTSLTLGHLPPGGRCFAILLRTT